MSAKPSSSDEPLTPAFVPKQGVESLRTHMGEWVAFDSEDELRGSGATFGQAYAHAKAAGVADPLVFFVPDRPFIG